MTLAKIHPASRRLLRLHGWLLMGWAVFVGYATQLLMVHVLHVQLYGVRYAVGAGAVYFVGFVGGGWYYLRWWNARPATDTDRPTHAQPADEQAYLEEEKAVQKKFEWMNGLGDWGGGGDDPLSALLAIITLLLLVVALAFFAGYFPWFATEALGGYLAEIVLEFVIGAVLLRRVVQPRPADDYWQFIVRKTWLGGFVWVALACIVGFVRDQG